MGRTERSRTSNCMVTSIFRTHSAIAISVEACHGFLGEEGEGLLEDCKSRHIVSAMWSMISIQVGKPPPT